MVKHWSGISAGAEDHSWCPVAGLWVEYHHQTDLAEVGWLGIPWPLHKKQKGYRSGDIWGQGRLLKHYFAAGWLFYWGATQVRPWGGARWGGLCLLSCLYQINSTTLGSRLNPQPEFLMPAFSEDLLFYCWKSLLLMIDYSAWRQMFGVFCFTLWWSQPIKRSAYVYNLYTLQHHRHNSRWNPKSLVCSGVT